MCKGLTFLIKSFICRIIGVDYLWIWSQFAWRLFTLSYSVSNQKLPAQCNQIKARPTSWQTAPVCDCVCTVCLSVNRCLCVWLSFVCTIDCWPHERRTQRLPLLCCFVILQPINIDISPRIATTAGSVAYVERASCCPGKSCWLTAWHLQHSSVSSERHLIAVQIWLGLSVFLQSNIILHTLLTLALTVYHALPSFYLKKSIIKEGYLLKQNWYFQRWRRRYFRLKRNFLYYAKHGKVSKAHNK